jgi:hypothetical protein
MVTTLAAAARSAVTNGVHGSAPNHVLKSGAEFCQRRHGGNSVIQGRQADLVGHGLREAELARRKTFALSTWSVASWRAISPVRTSSLLKPWISS